MRYRLDDPRLQVEIDRMADEIEASWPQFDEQTLAKLARLVAEPTPVPARRAA